MEEIRVKGRSPQSYETSTGKFVGHASGVSNFLIAVAKTPSGGFDLTPSGVGGTARRIMDGYVHVPRKVFFPDSKMG